MGELINGRMPEHIKSGLRCRVIGDVECPDCAYYGTVLYEIGQREYECDDIDRDALALIERLESERDAALAKVPKWISVKERLPEDVILDGKKSTRYKAIKVLVAIKGSNGVTTIRTQTRFKDYSYKSGKEYLEWRWRESSGKVTHWMPLPKPPKEDTHG